MKDVQPRILIVDDIESSRDILKRQLERRGFSISTATGGRRALELLVDYKIDIVLLDIMMPEFSGVETLKVIRADKRWKDLPIIMVTAKDERDALTECFDNGANDYVSKPVHMPILCARMGAQLSRKWALDAVFQTQKRLEETVNERTQKLQQAVKDLEHEAVEREQARTEAALARVRLLDAIEALSDGFALFDTELKLQIANNMFYELYELPPGQPPVGTPYENILRMVVEKGVIPEAVGRESEWIKQQLVIAGTEMEHETALFVGRERWLRVAQRKTSQGEMVGVYSDVSNQKLVEDELRKAALRDPLTGIYNRRHITTVLAGEVARWQRYQTPLSLMMLDIDYFKHVNDAHGHEAGDQVLCKITALLKSKLRRSDTLARWGGEEFIALLPDTGQDQGCLLGERIRAIVSESTILCQTERLNISISIGVVTMSHQFESAEELIVGADNALYRAKESGRNRVCI
ncbi:diguanylate cyclase [Amphritea sp. HPY]|uniref:diguanylate cyclase n=1 Tax=Amphritea sp. HPY TaxID=3421652 RepID=UPI003D7C6197